MSSCVVGIAIAGILIASTAAASAGERTTTFRSNLEIAGKQIPLPEGEWIAAGTGTELFVRGVGAPAALVQNLVLFKTGADAVEAFVVIHTNLLPAVANWGVSHDCLSRPVSEAGADAGPDRRVAAIFERRNRHYRCDFVKVVDFSKDPLPAASWSRAARLAEAQRWRLPDRWVMAGFRVADDFDVIDVRYGFDPRALAAAPARDRRLIAPDWPVRRLPARSEPGDRDQPPAAGPEDSPPGVLSADPQNLSDTAVQTLAHWTEAVRYPVERGFRNQLDRDPSLPMPRLDLDVLPPLEAISRLGRLTELRDAGWLSDSEFRAQRSSILRPFDPETDNEIDIWGLGLWKTIVHRTQSTVWSLGMNYLFLGNVYLAGGLALTKAVFSTGRYYLHELAWNTWGPRRNPELPVIDFGPVVVR